MGKWLNMLLEKRLAPSIQEIPEAVTQQTVKTDKTTQELTSANLGSVGISDTSGIQRVEINYFTQKKDCDAWYAHYWCCDICQRHHSQQTKRPFLPSPCPVGNKLKKSYDKGQSLSH